ncbi:unnamed protein product [Heterobilharzia americana]|nr:unnamed protein product [Heterobilharzia americana]
MALRSITRFSRIARVGSLPVTQFRYPVQFEVKSCSTLRLNSTLTTGDPEQSTSPNESGQDMECLKVEMQQLVEKYASLEDKYKRALAESENTRKRLLKQIDDAKLFGIQSFCKDLLEVADILTAATESSPQDQLQKGVNPAFANLYNGLKMTETQLFKMLTLRFNLTS